jgi:2-polyprenyl-6-methoxyphenol hydroxylase-like FAD-dependent oxidoreductase
MRPAQQAYHDVVIVGAGPVGLATARLLGLRGHDVMVVERWPGPYPLPRAVHFDDEIGRVFQSMALGDEIRAISQAVPDFYEWRNAAGEALLRIDWSGMGPSGWPTANFFYQPDLEALLTRAVSQMPSVELRRGAEVVGLTENDHHVVVTLAGNDTVRGRFVVGCDGANSFVRHHIATPVHTEEFVYDWLIVDTVPLDEREWSPQNWQLCDPARPTTVVSGGPGRRRWEFMRLPGESIADLDTLATAWRLLEPWGRTPANTRLERHCVYTFSAQWAERWNRGRLAIAGDAAHLMPPFAGQGMCSGLRDAANLSWKLDRILRGESDPQLLDTYTSERSTHLQHAIAMSVELGRVICVLDEKKAAERDARMIAGGADPAKVLPVTARPVLGPGVISAGADPTGLRGTLVPQFAVTSDYGQAPLDDIVGQCAMLLINSRLPADDALSREVRESLAEIEVTAMTVSDSGTSDVGDPTGRWTEWFTASHAAAVMVRPDHYIFGALADAADAATLRDEYRDSLLLPASGRV